MAAPDPSRARACHGHPSMAVALGNPTFMVYLGPFNLNAGRTIKMVPTMNKFSSDEPTQGMYHGNRCRSKWQIQYRQNAFLVGG
jgi:hypothetical protein